MDPCGWLMSNPRRPNPPPPPPRPPTPPPPGPPPNVPPPNPGPNPGEPPKPARMPFGCEVSPKRGCNSLGPNELSGFDTFPETATLSVALSGAIPGIGI